MPFSYNHQEALKRYRFITHMTWNYTAHQGPYSEVQREGRGGEGGGERRGGKDKRACTHGLGFCFYWGTRWGLRISQAHSLLVDLKLKGCNLKWTMRKQTSSPNGQLLKSTKIPKTKEPGWAGSLVLHLVTWPTLCSMRQASLKWVPLWKGNSSNQSLSQALALQKKKKTACIRTHATNAQTALS